MKTKREWLWRVAPTFFVIVLIVCTPVTTGRALERLVLPSDNLCVVDEGFDLRIRLLMRLGHIPSLSACIIKNQSIVWSKGYGYYDLKNRRVASNHTIYMAGSISKTFTATGLLQLSEKGYIDFDEDVNEYLPFPLRNPRYPDEPITVRMLLAHQSSLSEQLSFMVNFFFFNYSYDMLDDYLVPSGSIYDPRVWSERHPGEGFEYANVGFEILGYILERVSNQSLEKYCWEHIFQPLWMMNSSFHMADFNIKDLAVPYTRRLGVYIPFPHYDIGSSAAGGLRTSVVDLSRFLIMHINKGIYQGTRILEENSVEEMHTVKYPDSPNASFGYGLGWIIQEVDGETFGGHSGGVFGGIAFMFYRHSDQVGSIVFLNKNRVFSLRPHLLEVVALSSIQRALIEKADEL
jgi:CubicO group peptidase (beta-lactamase class C family)